VRSIQCFYSVGFIGIIFAVDVITVDTSTLRDRGFAFAFTASPWIICSYAGAKISEKFHETNWRWAYGCFAIILPFVTSGLVIILQLNKRKAVRAGMLVKRKSDRALWETTKHYFVEFDGGFVMLDEQKPGFKLTPSHWDLPHCRWIVPVPPPILHRR